MIKNQVPITFVNDSELNTNDPWDAFDRYLGLARDFFAAIGAVCTVAFLIGMSWGYFK